MNKKLNTALFYLAATAANLLLVLLLFVAVFVPYALWLAPGLSGGVNLAVLVLTILGAMAGSFPIYRWMILEFQKRVDMEKYFDPIVRQYGRRRR